ncbi:MAG: hypothetical protein IJX30_04995 [Clostridia bacterium]|nr:hypothetical protein [Clostridia bacterium]
MGKTKKLFLSVVFGVLMLFSLCFGVVFSMPTHTANAQTLSTENWTLAREGSGMFRIQNGNTYWSTYTNDVTTASMLDYTEVNGKTLSAINAEKPGAVQVTLQPAGGSIGSFYRVTINTEIAGFTMSDVGTVVIRSGWSHTDANATYTIDTDLYFAHQQGSASNNDNWKYVPKANVVDVSDLLKVQDQGSLYANSRTILLSTSDTACWESTPATPNENGGAFLNTLYINGTSIKEWNNKAEAMLANGEITDITFGAEQGNIKNGAPYAPIFGMNGVADGLGSIMQVTMPTAYIDNVSSFKVAKGFANLTDAGTLYIAEKDVEYVKSGSSFVKVASTVDISDAFKLLVQDYTDSNGTMLYYLHTNNTQYWTAQYDSTGAYSINEKEWKGASGDAQGGAVQMSYLEVNGKSVYDINASDNNAYGATQGNIASGTKYAPILAFLTPEELGNAIKLQIPSAYPNGSGTAADNHKTIAIKKGFYVVDTSTNIKYEVTRDIQWDYLDGAWGEHVEQIQTSVTHATLFGDSSDAFAGIALEGSDYENAPGTYAGAAKTALSFAQSANFRSHILIDDVALPQPGEAFLNVWGNKGYFTFRPGNNSATKITVLAGCQFPTYDALLNGTNEVYVTTEDVTYVKGSDGTWALDEGGLKAGEYETSIESVTYARDNENNWMMFTLTEKDYPNAAETYNVATTEEQISKLNLYDKITVDGYTLRSRIATYGVPAEAPKINLWVADCLGIRIAGCANGEGLDAINGAKRVVIKAGAQFPSYAYITEGIEAYYVTTENITFVNVGADNGVWEREYTVKFVADGVTVDEIAYNTVSGGLTAPEVPEKEGYKGAWEIYTLGGDITVNAVYTKNPTSLGTTDITNIQCENTVFWIYLGNCDYPTCDTSTDALTAATCNLNISTANIKKMNTLDYITVNGTSLADFTINAIYLNKWVRPDSISVELASFSLTEGTTVVIKAGCEMPSYQFQNAPTDDNAFACYTVDADYTCVYSGGAWTITSEIVGDLAIPTDFEDHYVLSDLYNVGYAKTSVMKDGIEKLTYTDGSETDYRYGHIDSTSFTLTFDFQYTGANYYDTFYVNLGTEGYGGNKFHFGWRFYLLRGDASNTVPNFCVEYFSNTSTYNGNIEAITLGSSALVVGQTYRVTVGYKLLNASTGEVQVYTALDQYSKMNTYTLGGDFIGFAPYINSVTLSVNGSASVIVSDPDVDMTATEKYNLVLKDGNVVIADVAVDTYVLPSLDPVDYDKSGNVFVGWTTDSANLSNLYPAGCEFAVNADTTLYPVWIGFKMRNGAAVRIASGDSGLRFIVDVDGAAYTTGVDLGLITEIGTILAPTDYLTKEELTFNLPSHKYTSIVTTNWQSTNCYSAAFINLTADQYARSFSARGYMKINYTTGEDYIYTAYDKNENARSIYEVATAAYDDTETNYKNNAAILGYVNAVADVTIDSNLSVSKAETARGSYTPTGSVSDRVVTISVDNGVQAALINGVRVVMGEDVQVVIDGKSYTLSSYKLASGGLQLTFTVASTGDVALVKNYYLSVLNGYLNSTAYTAEHEKVVDDLAQTALDAIPDDVTNFAWTEIDEKIAEIETIKTAEELANNNTGDTMLDAPVLSKGLGYTVTWTAVDNADYYTVSDDNDYRQRVVRYDDETLSYKAEVVGNHNITVTAHSYYEAYNSATSNEVATPEVKPVFSYKSMSDGLYKFSSSQMSTMGISTTGYYQDSGDGMYFAYYNKDIGWTPYPAQATDWTSPAEFPVHAQRLKDMGNNVILIAYDTSGAYAADETWEASRMRYIMDTAWSMGMKVLVCDEVFYKLSMSDNSGTGATSKAQVTTAINARDGFAKYVTHPAFYGFSLDDEPHSSYIEAMSYTISALDDACEALGVSDPFYLACLYQSQGRIDLYTKNSLQSYYKKWLAIEGVDSKYLYVDVYTSHAVAQDKSRYENTFDVVYGDSYLGGKYDFYQAITAHTQDDGTLLEQDLYMSLLYAAAHDVAGYSWFCYFPISGELSGSMVGFDGNGLGNGTGNNASGSYYNAAKTAGYQFELIQGLLDGYDWKTRSVSGNLLTTTLSNGTNTATMYVNADLANMSGTVDCTASGSQCYLVGYGVGTAEAPYQAVSGSVTLQPGQAVICIS